jgi:hypothetical protein
MMLNEKGNSELEAKRNNVTYDSSMIDYRNR